MFMIKHHKRKLNTNGKLIIIGSFAIVIISEIIISELIYIYKIGFIP